MIEGSVWRGILLSSRLRKTAAMRGRSLARAGLELDDRGQGDDLPHASAPAPRCGRAAGPITSRKRCVMRRTSARAASGDCGTS